MTPPRSHPLPDSYSTPRPCSEDPGPSVPLSSLSVHHLPSPPCRAACIGQVDETDLALVVCTTTPSSSSCPSQSSPRRFGTSLWLFRRTARSSTSPSRTSLLRSPSPPPTRSSRLSESAGIPRQSMRRAGYEGSRQGIYEFRGRTEV